jgi:hypothetical protein
MKYVERRKELQDEIQKCAKVARVASGQGAPNFDHAMAEIQVDIGLLNDLGNQEIAEAHSELTRKTEELTRATGRLKVATWILFFATFALFLVTIYEIVCRFV